MSKIFQNFYVIAPVAILEVPLPLSDFQKKDESGELIPNEYMNITEYLATINHTVERFNNDKTKFCKGFAFNLNGLDEFRDGLTNFGLVLGTDVLVLTVNEVDEELAKVEWVAPESVA